MTDHQDHHSANDGNDTDDAAVGYDGREQHQDAPDADHIEGSDTPADGSSTDADDTSDDDNGDDATGAGLSDDRAATTFPPHLQQWYRNVTTAGTLTIHYRTRDVVLTVDGDAGLRAVAVWAGARQHADALDPRNSSAASGWIGIDLDEAMGIMWMPGAIAAHDRAIVDPVV